MKLLSLITISAFLVSAGTMHGRIQAAAPDLPSASSPQDLRAIKITRSGSQRITEGAAGHFTGTVHIEPLFDPIEPSRTVGATVTFEPGARTVWHTHPLGQTLIVTAGVGWIQQWRGSVEEIRKGDVVWIPAGTKHWHGATPTTSMTHTAITEELDGNAVTWMEKVSDEEYRKR
jgi:quercetin dioxygenase-like cupin family protein